MHVFITGASGYIGSAVAAAFARAGHRVCGLVHTPSKARALAAREVEVVVGSLDAPAAFAERARESDVLIHCASEYSKRNAELDRATIETFTGAAARAQAPRVFLYTSGVWVYGDTGDGRATEATLPRPPALVAARVEHERMVLAANGGLLRTLVIRPGCVYGESGSLTADWFASASESGAARIVGEGSNRWAVVHLHDLADLYLRAAESPLGGEIFNAVDRSRFTQHECARAASRAAGAGGKVRSMSPAEAQESFGRMAECLAFTQHVDASKAVRLLGWQPRHGGFVDGVESYFTAWKASQES